MIYPAIDLMNGKAVQLIGGKQKKIEMNNPLELAKKFGRFGEIHIIDLDAAMSKGNNSELIREILKIAPARIGGGIRSSQQAQKVIEWGAEKIIIGTQANAQFMKELVKVIPKEKIIIALDSRKGKIVTQGWTKTTTKTPLELAKELEQYCSEFLYTCVDKEGKMNGIDWETITALRNATKNQVTIAGGISQLEEIKKLDQMNCNAVIGMALYANGCDLSKFVIPLLKWNEMELIPTIVQDVNTKKVLMLAYSNGKSIQKTWETGNAWYWSRSRKKLWLKGETSGSLQKVQRIRLDCDRDTLLFEVIQNGKGACHNGTYACFDSNRYFGLSKAMAVRG